MLKGKHLPGRFQGEATNTTIYILNQVATKSVIGETPFEALYKKKPKVHQLCTFECIAHVKELAPHLSKLQDQSTPFVFLGYETTSKAYRGFDPRTQKLHVSRDVLFEEDMEWSQELRVAENASDTNVFKIHLQVVPDKENREDIGENMSPTQEKLEDIGVDNNILEDNAESRNIDSTHSTSQ